MHEVLWPFLIHLVEAYNPLSNFTLRTVSKYHHWIACVLWFLIPSLFGGVFIQQKLYFFPPFSSLFTFFWFFFYFYTKMHTFSLDILSRIFILYAGCAVMLHSHCDRFKLKVCVPCLTCITLEVLRSGHPFAGDSSLMQLRSDWMAETFTISAKEKLWHFFHKSCHYSNYFSASRHLHSSLPSL